MRSPKRLLWLLPLLCIGVALFVPWPSSWLLPLRGSSVSITDRSGQTLYELRKPDAASRQPIALAAVPNACIDALIAIEDRTFFAHSGVSGRGILRALWQNLTSGRIVSGGSTITQQLIRSGAVRDRGLWAKLKEAFLALKLEQVWDKSQILEAYVNTVPFGHGAEGIAAAARTFFGKDPRELSLAECALLAGLPQSPTALDPFGHLAMAKKRQRLVLAAMRDTGMITTSQEKDAAEEPLTLATDRIAIKAPHFVMALLSEHPELLLSTSEIRTTLDWNLQRSVEQIVQRRLLDLQDKNVTSAAVVVLDAHTGDILAMLGSADYFDTDNDGAVNVALSPRQPGSALKPFTYALALAKGDTAATTVADTTVRFFTEEGNPYTPRNYDFDTHGLVRYREALANSYNIAAVKVLERVGVATLLQFLRAAGITTLTDTPEHYGLALTLGDGEVTLLELTSAYGMFARGGQTLTPRNLLSAPVALSASIVDPKIAWLITDILSDDTARLPQFGATGPLTFDFPVAAKTGTTRNSRDNWTIGYTPDVVVGVWVGNADNSPMCDTSGVTGAGPIFHDVMLAATRSLPPKDFTRPPGIVRRTICRMSGALPSPACGATMDEWFITGTEPRSPDDIFRLVAIDTRNGLLANNLCEQRFVEQKAFAVFPKEVDVWAREHGYFPPPSEVSPLCNQLSASQNSAGRIPRSSIESSIPRSSGKSSNPRSSEESSIPRSSGMGNTQRSNEGSTAEQKASSSASSDSPDSSWLEITSPQDHDSFRIDPLIAPDHQQLYFRAHASPDITAITWSVDDANIGESRAQDFSIKWLMKSGMHTIRASGNQKEALIRINVE